VGIGQYRCVVDLEAGLRDVVGAPAATLLADTLDLRTVGDLLGHLPRRYHSRGELTDLRSLPVGEFVTVQARVVKVERKQMKSSDRSYLVVTVTDGHGTLSLTFFNQPWRKKQLPPGLTAFFAGKVEDFRGRRQLTNPEVAPLDDETGDGGFAGALVPIYPAAAKIQSWTIARCVRLALDDLGVPGAELDDPLPAGLRARNRLVGLREAYELVHRPASRADVERAQARLKWDEALVVQVALARRRWASDATPATPRPARPGGLLAAFDGSLPFTLTDGQREVSATIAADLARSHPMHRLLQGEVGSGKTVVALRAMLTVLDAGGQAVLLAPTEVLAAQHHRSISAMLGPLARAGELGAADTATRVALLTGSLGARARRESLAAVADGTAGLVVGTHAVLEESVVFRDLGLVVVDEQHRFGVEQRAALRARSARPPHVLVMTATPIPRSVAMTVFGDLEVSSLTELPAGRSPIASFVVPGGKEVWVDRMWGRVRKEVAAGHQAYVVCPRIGGDASSDDVSGPDAARGAAVADILPMVREGELAGLRVEALHGRLPPDAKDAAMTAFAAGTIDVLVATTVVEVGVDVPNATVMIVMDADRFGVSQLHQLRGRVGRGSAPGWCLLHTEAAVGSPAGTRLAAVASTSDGAELAQLDLEQRREGDVLGVAQSGERRSLKLLELRRDVEVIRAARREAATLVAADPDLRDHPALARVLRATLNESSAGYLEKG
jgi:ATP-dependent DNA helicase RecG